jgi:GTP cyclohydrolase I
VTDHARGNGNGRAGPRALAAGGKDRARPPAGADVARVAARPRAGHLDLPRIEALTRELLSAFGEEPDREGLVRTPERVARAYADLLEGYERDLAREITTFESPDGYDGIVLSDGIEFFSLCEHHLLPFWGHAVVGYVPGERIIGLSKLARAVDIYAKRLQNQERLTAQVADALMEVLQPRGVAVQIRARHLCNISRGVEKRHSGMRTLIFRGVFRESPHLQQQFLALADESRPERLG